MKNKIVVDIKLYRNGQKAGFATISSDSIEEIISKFKDCVKLTYISSDLMNLIQENDKLNTSYNN